MENPELYEVRTNATGEKYYVAKVTPPPSEEEFQQIQQKMGWKKNSIQAVPVGNPFEEILKESKNNKVCR